MPPRLMTGLECPTVPLPLGFMRLYKVLNIPKAFIRPFRAFKRPHYRLARDPLYGLTRGGLAI